MDNIEITVFTPAYNRADTLQRVFESLKSQTFSRFEWIIVDDGSTDNTRDTVAAFKREGAFFDIIYFYQENRGKHVATNRAVKMSRGRFFITLDSDDACTADALQVFYEEWSKIPEEKRGEYYGISCRTCNEKGEINGTPMNVPYIDSNDLDLRYKHKITGELWGMIRKEIMQEYPFPEQEGYHYYPESVIWHNVGRKYKSRYINRALRYYINDCDNAVTNVHRNKAVKEKFVMRLHYINDCWDYARYDCKHYAEHLVGLTRDGMANGFTVRQVLKMLNSRTKRLLCLVLSPVGYILFKRS